MTETAEFRRRARRAYEWGRLRRAATRAWPALPLTALSAWLCHEPGTSIGIGATLFALTTGLCWYGRVASHAARAGLRAGAAAFAIPVVAFHSLAPDCCTFATMWIVNGLCGLGVGILLSIESTHMQTHRNPFLLLAGLAAALCGMLGCLLFGPMGLAGMAAGIVLSTAPVVIYRRAAA